MDSDWCRMPTQSEIMSSLKAGWAAFRGFPWRVWADIMAVNSYGAPNKPTVQVLGLDKTIEAALRTTTGVHVGTRAVSTAAASSSHGTSSSPLLAASSGSSSSISGWQYARNILVAFLFAALSGVMFLSLAASRKPPSLMSSVESGGFNFFLPFYFTFLLLNNGLKNWQRSKESSAYLPGANRFRRFLYLIFSVSNPWILGFEIFLAIILSGLVAYTNANLVTAIDISSEASWAQFVKNYIEGFLKNDLTQWCLLMPTFMLMFGASCKKMVSGFFSQMELLYFRFAVLAQANDTTLLGLFPHNPERIQAYIDRRHRSLVRDAVVESFGRQGESLLNAGAPQNLPVTAGAFRSHLRQADKLSTQSTFGIGLKVFFGKIALIGMLMLAWYSLAGSFRQTFEEGAIAKHLNEGEKAWILPFVAPQMMFNYLIAKVILAVLTKWASRFVFGTKQHFKNIYLWVMVATSSLLGWLSWGTAAPTLLTALKYFKGTLIPPFVRPGTAMINAYAAIAVVGLLVAWLFAKCGYKPVIIENQVSAVRDAIEALPSDHFISAESKELHGATFKSKVLGVDIAVYVLQFLVTFLVLFLGHAVTYPEKITAGSIVSLCGSSIRTMAFTLPVTMAFIFIKEFAYNKFTNLANLPTGGGAAPSVVAPRGASATASMSASTGPTVNHMHYQFSNFGRILRMALQMFYEALVALVGAIMFLSPMFGGEPLAKSTVLYIAMFAAAAVKSSRTYEEVSAGSQISRSIESQRLPVNAFFQQVDMPQKEGGPSADYKSTQRLGSLV